MSKMNKKELDKIIKTFEKEFGEGSIMNFNSSKNLEIDTISTGSLILDDLLGINGFPKGRIVELFGPESSRKTSLALHSIREVQEKGGVAAFIDAEHALDPIYAKKIGINLDDLIVSQPNSGEQAMDIVDRLINTNMIDLIIVDSVAALVPKSELEGNITDQTIGLQARLMSKSLRILSGSISKSKTIVLFINQLREKIGVMFGNPEVTSGGRSLRFYSSIRIDLRIRERIVKDSQIIGQKIKMKVVKNKLASPYKIGETILYYDRGFDKNEELVDLAIKKEVIKKSGSWYSYNNQKIGQGKKQAVNYIIENKLGEEIIKQIQK